MPIKEKETYMWMTIFGRYKTYIKRKKQRKRKEGSRMKK